MIGILGGAGPLAGLDVARKIIEETKATRDQEHLPVLLLSLPAQIPDRTDYLLGRTQENPGGPIADLFLRLEQAGATVAAIVCNTAHSEPIFGLVRQKLNEARSQLKILNIIEEVVTVIKSRFEPAARIAVLGTMGTQQQQLYALPLLAEGYVVLEPDRIDQEKVHGAIYNSGYGIKSHSSPVHKQAVKDLQQAMDVLIDQGAEAILLACTELPLALPEPDYKGVPLLDPNRLLARKLIASYAPEKLK